jgi:quercetin dioxygenase-like cupin family protein
MNSFLTPRNGLALIAGLLAARAASVGVYAALPSRTIDPSTVPAGTLAGQAAVDVLSVSAFTRAMNQAHGTNFVFQHVRFTPGQATGWHSHPGPDIVLVVGGSLSLTDEHCNTNTYTDGQGFATGLDVHQAVAGPNGADTYQVYMLPADATSTRTEPAGTFADPPNCAR